MHTARLLTACLFWACAIGVAYAYAAYPAVLYVLARLFGRVHSAPRLDDAQLPSVSLLIAAHNEETVIEDRIVNALAMDYPREKLEIIVASDGSTDETASIVRRYASAVRLLDYVDRRGKATVLNAAMRETHGEIILLSDANTYTDSQAARSLVRWFTNPCVGAVCGKLVLIDSQSGRNVDSMYWKYETFLKVNESRLGALLGANGAIYAIRREMLQPIPNHTIIDDFMIPLLAKQRFGCEIIYDQDATAREETAPDVATEFRRRTRIGAGGWQAIGMLWRLLSPRRGWIAFTFFSHKILRWTCPFFMLLLLATNLLLIGSSGYRILLCAQLALYLAALASGRLWKGAPLGRTLRLANMFLSMNAALLVGFFRWLSGPQTGIWSRTQRLSESVARPAALAGVSPDANA
jgi:cellulose synthase/poly-beta-1,6-N-acetylglucosamine synthase-like glycosyltransferase